MRKMEGTGWKTRAKRQRAAGDIGSADKTACGRSPSDEDVLVDGHGLADLVSFPHHGEGGVGGARVVHRCGRESNCRQSVVPAHTPPFTPLVRTLSIYTPAQLQCRLCHCGFPWKNCSFRRETHRKQAETQVRTGKQRLNVCGGGLSSHIDVVGLPSTRSRISLCLPVLHHVPFCNVQRSGQPPRGARFRFGRSAVAFYDSVRRANVGFNVCHFYQCGRRDETKYRVHFESMCVCVCVCVMSLSQAIVCLSGATD